MTTLPATSISRIDTPTDLFGIRLAEHNFEVEQALDLLGAEIVEVRLQRFLDQRGEPPHASTLRQGTQCLVLFGRDLDGRPHACMLARASPRVLSLDSPRSPATCPDSSQPAHDQVTA